MKNKKITVRKMALPLIITVLVMNGCSSVSEKSSIVAQADKIIIEKDKQISSLEASLQEERTARSRLEQDRESYVATSTSTQPQTPVSLSDLLPPNAKAGECYARSVYCTAV